MAGVATRGDASNGDETDSAILTSPTPDRRITRSNKEKQADTTTFDGTNGTPGLEFSGGGEGQGTTLDEVAWLIANLKAIITQQSGIIESLRAEVIEIK
jgi:hypothetical protein